MKNKKNRSVDILNNLTKLIKENTYVPIKSNYEEENGDLGILYGKFPQCYEVIQTNKGRDVRSYLLPLCNRAGFLDANVINHSMKVVSDLIASEDSNFDINELNRTLDILQHKKNTLSYEVAARKMGEKEYTNYIISKALKYFDLKN